MSRKRKGLIGGALGLVAGVAAVAVAVDRSASSRKHVVLPEPAAADRHGFVAVEDGVALYYEELGPKDAPLTVVFVHGFCLSLRGFRAQRAALRERFGGRVRLVFYDQRSHGRSGRDGDGNASIDQLGRDLATLLQTVAPSGPLVLVGHSMGGMTTLAVADGDPELFGPGGRVRGVVLISTSTGKLASVTFGFPAALARIKGPVLPMLLRGLRSRPDLVERGRAASSDLAWVLVKKFSFRREVEPAVVEDVASMIASTRIDVIADYYSTLMNHDKLRALDVLADTRVVVVCGDGDLITPPEHSREIAAALPSARLAIIEQAGHMVLLEAPDEVNELVGDLVAQVLADAPARS